MNDLLFMRAQKGLLIAAFGRLRVVVQIAVAQMGQSGPAHTGQRLPQHRIGDRHKLRFCATPPRERLSGASCA